MLLGDFGSFQEFGPWHNAELTAKFLLIGGKHQTNDKRTKLPPANDFLHIEVFPASLLGERQITLLVEFHAHAVGGLAADDSLHQISRLL